MMIKALVEARDEQGHWEGSLHKGLEFKVSRAQ